MATLLQAGPADHGDLRKNRHAAFRLRAAAPLDQKEKAPAAGWRLFFLRECSVWIPGFRWEATPGRGGDNPPQRRQIKTASRKTSCFYLPLPCKNDFPLTAPVPPPWRRPRGGAQQSGPVPKAKKRPVRLRGLAVRRGLVPKGALLSCRNEANRLFSFHLKRLRIVQII